MAEAMAVGKPVIATGYSFKGREIPVSTAAGSLPTRLKMEWIGVEEADPLRVLRVPLKRGRWLERSDVGEGVPSVLINETAARLLWPGQEAVGKRFRQFGQEKPSASDLAWLRDRGFDTAMIGRPYEVVGVVADGNDRARALIEYVVA